MITGYKYTAHIATLIALTGLAAIVFLRLVSLHEDLEKSSDDIIHHISNSEMSRVMSLHVAEIANKLDRLTLKPELSDDGPPFLPTHLFPKNQAEARHEPSNKCSPLVNYGTTLVSFRCATYSTQNQSSSSSSSTDTAADYLKATDATKRLIETYPLWQRISARDDPSTFTRDLPSILFVHLTITTPTEEIAAVFPGTHASQDFDFRDRPWYSPQRIVSDFKTTRIYHDYNTQRLVVSFIKEAKSKHGTVRFGADYQVQYSGASLGVYLLNTLLLLVAAATYLSFYATSSLQFVKYLAFSTLTVFAAYLALLLNEIFFDLGHSSLSNRFLITSLLTFLPSGTLLLLAAASIIRRQITNPILLFVVFYSFEFMSGVLSYLTSSSMFSTSFGCLSLVAFGWSVRWHGSHYSNQNHEIVAPHPNPISKWVAFSYTAWGFAQFSLLLLSEKATSFSNIVDNLTKKWYWMELLMTEPGSVTLLLYPKGVAIFFTILFLLSLEAARFKETLRSRKMPPFIQLDRSSRIINFHHFPEEPSLSSTKFTELIADKEDRDEFRYAMDHELELTSYLCSIPELSGVFGESLLEVTLSRIDAWGYPRRLWLHPVDRSKLNMDIDRQFCEDLGGFLENLQKSFHAISPPKNPLEINSSAWQEFSHTAFDEGHEVLERTKQELSIIKNKFVLAKPKMDGEPAWAMIKSEVDKFCKRNRSFTCIFKETEPPAPSPRLRITDSILRTAINALLSVVSGSYEKPLEKELRLSLTEPGSGIESTGGSFVCFILHVPWSKYLKDSLVRARNAERGIESDRNLVLARNLLEFFNGELVDDDNGNDIAISMKVRYLYSSRKS